MPSVTASSTRFEPVEPIAVEHQEATRLGEQIGAAGEGRRHSDVFAGAACRRPGRQPRPHANRRDRAAPRRPGRARRRRSARRRPMTARGPFQHRRAEPQAVRQDRVHRFTDRNLAEPHSITFQMPQFPPKAGVLCASHEGPQTRRCRCVVCVLRDAPFGRSQDEVSLCWALRKNLILRRPRSGLLEGRTALIQAFPEFCKGPAFAGITGDGSHAASALSPWSCRSTWVIWPRIETAISACDTAPILRPTGAWMRASCCRRNRRRRRSSRLAWVLRGAERPI